MTIGMTVSASRIRQLAIFVFFVGIVYLFIDLTKLQVTVANLQKATFQQTNFHEDYSNTIIRGGYKIYQNAIRPNRR